LPSGIAAGLGQSSAHWESDDSLRTSRDRIGRSMRAADVPDHWMRIQVRLAARGPEKRVAGFAFSDMSSRRSGALLCRSG
jgi:hypothetical protein